MGGTSTRIRAVLTAVFIAAGLTAIGGTGALGAAVVQDGPVNYVGPGNPVGTCPAGTTDCLLTSGNVDVIQTAPSIGRNTIDCRGESCKGTQGGSTDTARPTNTATCNNSSTAASSDQRCELHQLGNSNTINATLSASPSTGGIVNLANVIQNSEQRFITSQQGTTNTLNVNGSISQTANSSVDASTPVTHDQRSLLSSLNTMNATTSNTANYVLTRSQTSSATGATPTELQDNTAGSESDGAVAGLGAVKLVATTPGTNSIKVRGTDTKSQNATSLNLGQATQQQGHAGGGWLVDLSGTETGTDGTGADVDLGSGTNYGLKKDWTQHAQGLLGASIAKDQDQLDKITIPIIGQSPFDTVSSVLNKLRTDDGGHQDCNGDAKGHAKNLWSARIECDMAAGAKIQHPTVSVAARDVDASIACSLNTDVCPAPVVRPSSHAHLAVRNATNNEAFTADAAPSSTSAAPGNNVEYRATFHNDGDAASVAHGGTLALPIPSNTTFVSCSDTCASGGGIASWNLPDVAGGTSVARTLLVKVNTGTAAGTQITNTATGDQDGAGPDAAFTSNATTVNVTAPPTITVQIKIFGAQSGKQPVAILTTPTFNAASVDSTTVCFGESDPAHANERDCTIANGGTSMTDVDADGDADLKMHFDTAETGIDLLDTTACLTGRTTSGQAISGCGPLPKK